MASVLDVAQYILRKTGPISTWKLQKLVYYAQAWHCVWEDVPLFNSKIQAWANGPVCRELYDAHKGQFSVNSIKGGKSEQLRKSEKETIDGIVEYYNKYNGQQLSDLTHRETPWKKARKGLALDERGEAEITLESMNEYYSSL